MSQSAPGGLIGPPEWRSATSAPVRPHASARSLRNLYPLGAAPPLPWLPEACPHSIKRGEYGLWNWVGKSRIGKRCHQATVVVLLRITQVEDPEAAHLASGLRQE